MRSGWKFVVVSTKFLVALFLMGVLIRRCLQGFNHPKLPGEFAVSFILLWVVIMVGVLYFCHLILTCFKHKEREHA